MQDERDVVEKVLKALGEVEVPEGLEARVVAGLERGAGRREVRLGWRDAVRGSNLAVVWWRGAVSGAAIALLGVGLFVVVSPLRFGRSEANANREREAATKAPVSGSKSSPTTPVQLRFVEIALKHCSSAVVSRASKVSPSHEPEFVQVAGVERTYPADEPALTAEERELVRLTHRVAPKDLTSLDPDVRAQMQAQDIAEFEKFFYQAPLKVTDQIETQ